MNRMVHENHGTMTRPFRKPFKFHEGELGAGVGAPHAPGKADANKEAEPVMKSILTKISRAAAIAVCAFSATQIHASTMPNVTMNVPFEFVVSGKTLPAGEYSVFRANGPSGIPALAIRNTKTANGAITFTSQRSVEGAGKSEATFVCRESKCYFVELKTSSMESYVAPVPRVSRSQKERMISLGVRTSAHAD